MSMKSATTMAGNYKSLTTCSVGSESTEKTSNTAQVKTRWSREEYNRIQATVNYLFELLERTWPAKFAKDYPTNETRIRSKAIWRECYQFGILTKEQVRAGYDAAVTQKWMPGLADFLQFCPSDQVSPDAAWQEVCDHSHDPVNHQWSSHLVRDAGSLTNWYRIKTATGSSVSIVRKCFVEHYTTLCTKATGQPVSSDAQQIEDSYSNKTAAELTDLQTEQLIKNQVISDGCSKAAGMSDVFKMMGEE